MWSGSQEGGGWEGELSKTWQPHSGGGQCTVALSCFFKMHSNIPHARIHAFKLDT